MRRTRRVACILSAALLAAACGGGATSSATVAPPTASATADPNALPTPELGKVRIGISAPTEPVQFAEKFAEVLGYYQKFGLSVEITGFEGDGKALQSLVAGQIDMFVGGASAAINTVPTDTVVKVVAMNSVTLSDGLFCSKDIKTAADLRGKTIGIGTFGATAHGAALLMLKGLGLTTKDVTITQAGNEGTRLAALKGGSLTCTVADMANLSTFGPLGFNVVIDLSKAKLQWGRSGLAAPATFIAKYPNTVLAAVAATLLAQNAMWTDTKTATEKYAAFAQVKPDAAVSAVNAFLDYGSRSMFFTVEAFTTPRDVLATVNPAMATVDVTKAFDLSFLNRLKDNGFYQRNGIPLG